eukprot:2771620-Rhodomonas_salina.2
MPVMTLAYPGTIDLVAGYPGRSSSWRGHGLGNCNTIEKRELVLLDGEPLRGRLTTGRAVE